jgi:hypothetical protein
MSEKKFYEIDNWCQWNKTFFFVTDASANTFLNANLVIETRAGAYLSEHTTVPLPMGMLLALITNIIQASRNL